MDDLASLTLRELLILARERLGSDASKLKTRAEVLAALQGGPAPAPEAPAAPAVPVVTRDFFRRQS